MMWFKLFFLVYLNIAFYLNIYSMSSEEEKAIRWLDFFNYSAEIHSYDFNEIEWEYYTNMTDANRLKMVEAEAEFAVWMAEAATNASKFNPSKINDTTIQRLLKKIGTVGIKLNKEDNQILSNYISEMVEIYNTKSICAWENGRRNCSRKWNLYPDLTEIMASSRDYELLKYVWKQWREVTKSVKPIYENFVELSNKGARAGGFEDTGSWWRYPYEVDNFEDVMSHLFYQILPFYEQLHTYFRRHLMHKYPGKFHSSAIPAHLLGNMWSQEFQNLYDFTQPYHGKGTLDVTSEMLQQSYNATKMFQLADEFFQSLGLLPMPEAFWKKSIIIKPENRTIECHPSAWDFCNRHDFRIKMCTSVNMNDLVTIHHEMGHIQYYLQYANQPITFREGANPGFQEAIGDTIALSVATPNHLKKIGLLKNFTHDRKQDINFLFKQAAERVAFLPFGYLIDYYRWKIFDGTYNKSEEWNQHWWDLRFQLQGVVPPSTRPSDAFDPAAKSHVNTNTPYMRYFIAMVAQFQFYEAMCHEAGHVGPLHTCDFYQNTNAGAKLAQLLQLGSSKSWPEAMKCLTGRESLNASAILQYFKPLSEYLVEKNDNSGDCYGWGADNSIPSEVLQHLSHPRCPKLFTKQSGPENDDDLFFI